MATVGGDGHERERQHDDGSSTPDHPPSRTVILLGDQELEPDTKGGDRHNQRKMRVDPRRRFPRLPGVAATNDVTLLVVEVEPPHARGEPDADDRSQRE